MNKNLDFIAGVIIGLLLSYMVLKLPTQQPIKDILFMLCFACIIFVLNLKK